MSSTMLAARLDLTNGKLRMETIPIPEASRGEVRLKVEAAGICLSDVHLLDGTLRLKPRGEITQVTLGHEVAGVIDRVGEGVTHLKVGQRALLHAGQTCGNCTPCLTGNPARCMRLLVRGVDYDGGWAEYAVARQDTVAVVPDELPIEQAAILPDAVSTPYAALLETAGLRPAESVGLWGIGGLGAHAVQLARIMGAAPILAFDLLPEARERALALGADAAFDPRREDLRAEVRRLTGGAGLDVAIDLAGVTAVRAQAQSVLAPYGRLVLVGITPDPMTIHHGVGFCATLQQVRGHYGSRMEHLFQLIKLTRYKRLELSRSISAVLPLSEAPAGVEKLATKQGNPIRIILKPQHGTL
jgi:D-arabinose 1-dehydrogenase-like Zn-dependent alcohol dehydrogenase